MVFTKHALILPYHDPNPRDVRSDLLAVALAFASAAYIAAVTALPGIGRPWQGAAAFAGGWLAWLLLAWRKRNAPRRGRPDPIAVAVWEIMAHRETETGGNRHLSGSTPRLARCASEV